jgi:hypothetical protein
MTREVSMAMMAHVHYKAGHLPEPGGWLDQAAPFTQAVAFISKLIGDHEEIARNSDG